MYGPDADADAAAAHFEAQFGQGGMQNIFAALKTDVSPTGGCTPTAKRLRIALCVCALSISSRLLAQAARWLCSRPLPSRPSRQSCLSLARLPRFVLAISALLAHAIASIGPDEQCRTGITA
jgi:hypothetical protein